MRDLGEELLLGLVLGIGIGIGYELVMLVTKRQH